MNAMSPIFSAAADDDATANSNNVHRDRNCNRDRNHVRDNDSSATDFGMTGDGIGRRGVGTHNVEIRTDHIPNPSSSSRGAISRQQHHHRLSNKNQSYSQSLSPSNSHNTLRRIHDHNTDSSCSYVLSLNNGAIELLFPRSHYEHVQRLFCIIDTESRGVLRRSQVDDFVRLRCPVFSRRDEQMRQSTEWRSRQQIMQQQAQQQQAHLQQQQQQQTQRQHQKTARGPCHSEGNLDTRRRSSAGTGAGSNGLLGCFPYEEERPLSTLDEVWNACCSSSRSSDNSHENENESELTLEGWMLFCRLIALAQYQEAKSRYSVKHRTTDRLPGSGLVLVDLPPPAPPAPLDPQTLVHRQDLPLPELDLNHCLLAAHDTDYAATTTSSHSREPAVAVVERFGEEFVVETTTTTKTGMNHECSYPPATATQKDRSRAMTTSISISSNTNAPTKKTTRVVRSPADVEWLNDTLVSHQTLGGTLCGRILPPLPIRKKHPSWRRMWGAMGGLVGGKRGSVGVSMSGEPKDDNDGAAKQLERCLNYLLEHPALRTSFPLNAILQASQSGLDSVKRLLEADEGAHSLLPTDATSFFSDPSLKWIRTAAQAAMALRVHGILDATGCLSASARLQHASIPSLDPSKWWRTATVTTVDNSGASAASTPPEAMPPPSSENFEKSVVTIESGLPGGNDYDLLPPPEQVSYGHQVDGRGDSATIDSDIHALYEIIHSLEDTLSKCRTLHGTIVDARRQRNDLHLAIVCGLDSWEGLKGEIVGEKALMEGVVGLKNVRAKVEEGDQEFNEALAWQSSLAKSAVNAAETVRSAVRAARTALSAKVAADSAALAAREHCSHIGGLDPKEGDDEELETEHEQARVRAAISQTHAIHSAVVEHEAFGAKRRAAMALAHDVQQWNAHRRRELLEFLKKYAGCQRDSARGSAASWALLRGRSARRDGIGGGAGGGIKVKDPLLIVPVEHRELVMGGTALNNSTSTVSDYPKLSSHTHAHVHPHTPNSTSPNSSDNNLVGSSSTDSTEENDVMTASMQSLVDGLMTWGGRYDPQDDMSLPSGMAVGIALEERGMLRPSEPPTAATPER